MEAIAQVFTQHHYLRINMTVTLLFEHEGSRYQHVYTTPPYTAVQGPPDVPEAALNQLVSSVDQHIDSFNPLHSGAELLGVYNVRLEFAHFEPLLGGCHGSTRLPKAVENKKAVIAVKNKAADGDCFKWAVLSAVYPADDHVDRVGKYRPYENLFDWSGIRFPTPLHDISKFEAANHLLHTQLGITTCSTSSCFQAYKHYCIVFACGEVTAADELRLPLLFAATED